MTQLNQGHQESWATRAGVILAVTGSAVGLGNFLRFPGVAAEHGGGTFMIPYIVAFLLLGVPIAWVEWSLGRYGGQRGFNSLAGAFFTLSRRRGVPYLGVLGLVLPVMIYTYYICVVGWCLAYAWHYLTGAMPMGQGVDYEAHFNGFVGAEEHGDAMGLTGSPFIFTVISFALSFFLIYRGITRGIEWFCKYAMPLLVLLALVMLGRVLTLPPVIDEDGERTVLDGLGYMWNPDLAALADPGIWLAAAGQVFFSLSVGFGIIVTYASYMKRDDDVALSSVTAASGNGFCEIVLAGLAIVPAGFLFLGLSFVEDPPGTFGMGFVALPGVFNAMPGGQFFGFLFFFLLFLAAVTSTISMLQPAIAFLEEGLNVGRKASVSILIFITAVGAGFIMYFSAGLTALDVMDFWSANLGLFVLATVTVIMYGWVLGVDRGMDELRHGAEIPVPAFIRYVIKYVSPALLLVIFGSWLYIESPGYLQTIVEEPVAMMATGLLVLVGVTFLLLIAQAAKRWRKQAAIREGMEVSE